MPLKREVGLLHAKFLRISYEKTKLIDSGKADIFSSKLTEKNNILHQIGLQLQYFGSNPHTTIEDFCKYFYSSYKEYGAYHFTSADDFYKQFTQEDLDAYNQRWRDKSLQSKSEKNVKTPSLDPGDEYNYIPPPEQKVAMSQSTYGLFPPPATMTTTSNDALYDYTTTTIPSKGY